MRRISVSAIQDGDILARDIYSSSGVILMSEGSKLKKEYGLRLADLHVENIFIYDDIQQTETGNIIEEEIKRQCGEAVRDAILKYTSADNDELKEMVKIADDIMKDILSEPNIMYNVSCIRDKSQELYLHSINVAAISSLIALRAKLSKSKAKEIAIGALLHDIGYTSISIDTTDLILEESDDMIRKEIMRHVIYGYSDVEKKDWVSKTVKDIILMHHERYDGSGYPFHANSEKIKMEIGIVSMCNQFDNMVYGRMVKRHKVREAMDYIMSQAGRQFDLALVQLFMESVAAYPIGTTVITNDGDIAVVVRQNFKFPTRPVIRLMKNAGGVPYESNEERDLVKNLTLFIVDSVED